jgi:chorismate synthase
MKNQWGKNIKVSIFGESHGRGIGALIEGLPAGMVPDDQLISGYLARRAPGKHKGITTERQESDAVDLLSGIFEGKFTGAPVCAMIWNEDQRSRDYDKIADIPRPGHADYPAYVKFNGHHDYRGGGVFSGRLTAALVYAGALAMQLLNERNIIIATHVLQLHRLCDTKIDPCKPNMQQLIDQRNQPFPTIIEGLGKQMEQRVREASATCDSVGGVVEAVVTGIPAGVGEPFFGSVESELSQMLFSIPAIKGIEFGDGFNIVNGYGSEMNDAYHYVEGKIKTKSNHNGGITGGITNSMPIVFKAAVKPTPSISKQQASVDIIEGKDCDLVIKGRHDACIVPRVLPVIEAATALVVLDLLLESEKIHGVK